MSILIDTCIWSLAFRRKMPLVNSFVIQKLNEFIEMGQVIMVGVIRQEILSGIQPAAQFERIRFKLGAFPDFPIDTQDFETAAQYSTDKWGSRYSTITEITGVTGRTAKLEIGWIIEPNNRIARLTTIRVSKKEK